MRRATAGEGEQMSRLSGSEYDLRLVRAERDQLANKPNKLADELRLERDRLVSDIATMQSVFQKKINRAEEARDVSRGQVKTLIDQRNTARKVGDDYSDRLRLARTANEKVVKERNLAIARDSDRVVVVVPAKLPPGFTGRVFPYCYHCKDRNPEHIKSGGCWTAWRAPEQEWIII